MPESESVTPSGYAATAADGIRALNHTLINAKAVPAPELSATVQALITLLDRLPQALSSISTHLVREQKAERVRMDNATDPAAAVIDVDTHLTDAEADLADVTAHLRQAGALLFAMGTPFDGSED
ncbi:hypothetical protein C0216_08795 [Streptomyces globosus]|uniref:Uncharacterized protein n=1 Tax=Streptomyces globosus TaxID=68209 RepID=A0A344TY26_9ACTN|nr:hypothetical protein [Streptomyces globosus]AXE23547.1 hypothetical protein C0216_08795 [Streptomyces globosus]